MADGCTKRTGQASKSTGSHFDDEAEIEGRSTREKMVHQPSGSSEESCNLLPIQKETYAMPLPVVNIHSSAGAREPGGGGGGKGSNCPPTFCLKGMDMPVPPLNFCNH